MSSAAATNLEIKEALEQKTFREDLFYRLNVFPIHVPPLRDRREDIPPLLEFFIKHYSKEFRKKICDVSRSALDLLMRYHWPGNVRELRNVVERICIMHSQETITPECLPREIWGDKPQNETSFDYQIPPEGILFEEIVGKLEKDLVTQAVGITGGNVAKTARLLNLPRGTLRYKMEKYGLTETS